jgi:hypothetical protein
MKKQQAGVGLGLATSPDGLRITEASNRTLLFLCLFIISLVNNARLIVLFIRLFRMAQQLAVVRFRSETYCVLLTNRR